MSKILEFKEGHELITLPDLRQTVKARDLGRSKSIEHFEVYDDIVSILQKNNLPYEIKPISIPNGKSSIFIEKIEEQYGKNSIDSLFVNKLFGSIELPNLSNEETSVELRIDFNERGVQVAFGKVVLKCTNGMTAFESDYAATYGQNKMKYEQLNELVSGWIAQSYDKSKKYDLLIDQMKEIELNEGEVSNMIGDLNISAVKQAYLQGPVAPLNISQLSTFTKDIIRSEEKANNLWEFYNIATNLQKPNKMDSMNIIPTNFALTKFLTNRYINN